MPTTVYCARRILTLNTSRPEANHVAVRDGRILGVGSLEELQGWGALELDERFDGRHNPYYWIGFSRQRSTPARGTDLEAIADQRISITPLRLDLTDEPSVTRLAADFA